jgi:hypothetical protein
LLTTCAGEEKCVHEQFEKDKTVHLFFEVVVGAQQEIDVTVFSPENEELYTAHSEQEGSYSFLAKTAGRYRFCFSNGGASSSAKLVSFEVTSGANINDIAAHPDHITPLEQGVLQLSEAMAAVSEDSKYMYHREEHHRALTESTYERLRIMAVVEAIVLVAMSIGQIYYLRRFFEVKRVV